MNKIEYKNISEKLWEMFEFIDEDRESLDSAFNGEFFEEVRKEMLVEGLSGLNPENVYTFNEDE